MVSPVTGGGVVCDFKAWSRLGRCKLRAEFHPQLPQKVLADPSAHPSYRRSQQTYGEGCAVFLCSRRLLLSSREGQGGWRVSEMRDGIRRSRFRGLRRTIRAMRRGPPVAG
jgi:hypothetical protein